MKCNTDKKTEFIQHSTSLHPDEKFKLSDSKKILQVNSGGSLKNYCTLLDKDTKKHSTIFDKDDGKSSKNNTKKDKIFNESNISTFMLNRVIPKEDEKIKKYINQMGIEIMKQNQEEGLISHNFKRLTKQNSLKECEKIPAGPVRHSMEVLPHQGSGCWSPSWLVRQRRKTATSQRVSCENESDVREVNDCNHFQIQEKKFTTPKLEGRHLDYQFRSPERSSKIQKKIDDYLKKENIPNYDNCDSSLNSLLFSKQLLHRADESTDNQDITSSSVNDIDGQYKQRNSIKGIINYSNPIFEDTTKISKTVDNINIKPRELIQKNEDQDSNRSLKEFCPVYDSLSDNEDDGESKQIINYEEEDGFVFQPNSLLKKFWSYLVMALICYSLTFAPYYMAFQESETGVNLYLDVIIDMLFLIDIGINFFTPYYDSEDNLILNQKMIVTNYLKSWFATDFISSFPFGLLNLLSDDYNEGYSSIKRIMRISRLYRLFKWLKIFRIIKLANKQNRRGLISFKNFIHSLELNRVLTFLFIFLIMIHVSSCLWIFIGFSQDTDDNWITRQNLFDSDNLSLYIASVYFNFVTVLTIGYGDIISHTLTERVYNIFLLFIGVLTFSFALSSLSTVFADMDRAITKKEIRLVILEDIKDKYQIPQDLYVKLKKSIRSEVKSAQIDRYQFIDTLPASIKNDLILTMHRNHIKQLQFFKDQRHDFIIFVIPLLRPHVLKQEEVIFSIGEIVDQMVLVIKGCLGLRMGSTYDNIEIAQIGENDHFGDILMNQNAQSPYEARARVHSEVMILKQENFDRVKDNFIDATNYILGNSLQKMELIETRRKLIQVMNQSGFPTSKMISILKRINLIILERNFNDYYYNDKQLIDFSDYLGQLTYEQVLDLIFIASEGILETKNTLNKMSTNCHHVATYSKHATGFEPSDCSVHDSPTETNKKHSISRINDKDDPSLSFSSIVKRTSTKHQNELHAATNLPEYASPHLDSDFTMAADEISNKKKKSFVHNKIIKQTTKKIIKNILLVNKWKSRSKKNSTELNDVQNENLENDTETMDPMTPKDNNRIANPGIVPSSRKSLINLNDDLKLSALKREISVMSKLNMKCFNAGENPQFSKIKEDIEILGKLTKERRKSNLCNDEECKKKNSYTSIIPNPSKLPINSSPINGHRNKLNENFPNMTFQQNKVNVGVPSQAMEGNNSPKDAPVNVNLYSTTHNFNTNIIFLQSKDQKSSCINSIPIPKIQNAIQKLIEKPTEASEDKKVKMIEKSMKRLKTLFSIFKLIFAKMLETRTAS